MIIRDSIKSRDTIFNVHNHLGQSRITVVCFNKSILIIYRHVIQTKWIKGILKCFSFVSVGPSRSNILIKFKLISQTSLKFEIVNSPRK